MMVRSIGAAGLAIFAMTLAAPLYAQHRDPNLDPEDQLSPSQMQQPMPGAVATPGGAAAPARRAAATPARSEAAAPAHAAAARTVAAPPNAPKTVTCSGAFSKDSSNLRLAMTFDSRNVAFTDENVSGSTVGASIVYPNDPKRRLEVWWSNAANRSDTYLILINGQSAWVGPNGLKLGLTLADLEKLNHKPFKVKGFDKDGVASVSDWDGGALTTIPGGCKSGISLKPDAKTAPDALSALPAEQEFSSSDPAMRAVKPKVSEILLGYQ
jgi:hypothetical protein